MLGFVINLLNVIKYTLKLKPMAAITAIIQHEKQRGMSVRRDLVDWIGGFPFEFARYEVLLHYMHSRGWELVQGKRAISLGCHEMVFRRSAC
jgi:2-polyprenyl-6-hydroxyphenyl methylase/3-demethylubiquinone-9 3-methyltransferase